MKKVKFKVEGFGGKKIIGFWDENEQKFIRKKGKIFNFFIKQHIKNHINMFELGYPLHLVIAKKKMEKSNSYHTYVSVADPDKTSRTVFFISAKNFEKFSNYKKVKNLKNKLS